MRSKQGCSFKMNFKIYDILSSLIPGFLLVIVGLYFLDISYNNDFVVAYTAIAFLVGYIVNSLSSWLEGFYFFTWRGKPSTRLLDGKDIWKVRFYHSQKVKKLLESELNESVSQTNDVLFSIAMRYTSKEGRVEDFISIYAFSRSLLTCCILGTIIYLIKNYDDWRYYITLLPTVAIVWLRCKQQGYYYAKEVLNCYLKLKSNT